MRKWNNILVIFQKDFGTKKYDEVLTKQIRYVQIESSFNE